MIKLNWITSADRFAPPCEHWDIDQDIRIDLTRYEKHAILTIMNQTGDITDQIYNMAKNLDYFSDLKLGGISCYSIEIPLEKVDDFLKYVQRVDRALLKEGKVY